MATSRIVEHVGRVLSDRYRLTRPLGTGASAHVYVAEDVTLRRRVAVKLLHPGLADDEAFLRRFQAEARVVAALRHPNIVRVYDWGEDHGTPFLVMELLEGGSLRSLLDRGQRLTPAQAARIGVDAARALDYAHRRGLVHRDIKPANLLFDEDGQVSVADFGLARALAEATWTEPVGAMVGTARYAAPEQIGGGALDGKADVYSLALVLVEAVTGNVPFASDTTLGTLMARVDRDVPVPEAMGALRPAVLAAGTPDPTTRSDAAALALALAGAARQLPPPTRLVLVAAAERTDIDEDPDLTELPGRARLFDAERVDRADRSGGEASGPGNGRSAGATNDVADGGDPPKGRGADPGEGPAKGMGGAPSEGPGGGGSRGLVGSPGGGPTTAAVAPFDGAQPPSRAAATGSSAGDAGDPGDAENNHAGAARSAAAGDVADGALRSSRTQLDRSRPTGRPRVREPLRPLPTAGPLPPPGKPGKRRPARTTAAPRRRRRWPVVLLIVLLAGGSGAGYVAWTASHKPRHPVPNLVAATPAQAQRTLVGLHFHLRVTQAYNDHVAKGLIVSQALPPHSLVREGTAVAVVESLGPPPETVPDLTGLSLNDATNRLIGAQFTLGVVSRRFDNTPKETVLSWSGQGGQLPKGSAVDLVVSNGPPVVSVPKLPTGSTFPAAQAVLAPLPLTAVESDAFSNTVPKGQVISTSPAAGASVQVSTKVTVTVSKGPDLVPVTNVAGSSVDAATQALQADGFKVIGVSGNPTRNVTHTSPAAGTQVLRGSSITLFTT